MATNAAAVRHRTEMAPASGRDATRTSTLYNEQKVAPEGSIDRSKLGYDLHSK